MNIRMKRLLLLFPGTLGLVYGGATMFFHNVALHATGRCCGGSGGSACGSNQFCVAVNNLTACDPNNYNYCATVAN